MMSGIGIWIKSDEDEVRVKGTAAVTVDLLNFKAFVKTIVDETIDKAALHQLVYDAVEGSLSDLKPEIKEIMLQVLREAAVEGAIPGESTAYAEIPNLFIVGHEVYVPKMNGFAELGNKIQGFARMEKVSDDIIGFRITQLSLWEAASRGMTSDEVIDFLKRHSRTPPNAGVRNWIARTMSNWGAVRIEGEGDYNVLVTADESIMNRLTSTKQIKAHLYRQLAPTRYRIVNGRRSTIKQLLLNLGYPVRDFGLLEDFNPLKIGWKEGEPTWRSIQRETLDRLQKYKNGVMISPAGSGKTLTGIGATVETQAPTLVFVTRAELADQWKREYQKWTDISAYNIAVFHGDSGDRTVRPITITTYQTAVQSTKRHVKNMMKTKWGLIIFDEVQHTPADLWRNSAEDVQSIRKLGLTATPIREDKKEKEIFSLVGPPLIDVSWLEAADEGWIAEAEAYEVLVPLRPTDRKTYNSAQSEWPRVITTANNPLKVKAVEYLLDENPGEIVLIIAYYLDLAYEISKKLDIPIATGKTTNKKRNELYAKMRTGELTQLVVTSIAEEGIDIPEATMGINISGLYGSRMGFSQRFGRILRAKDKTAKFYEVITEGTIEQEYSENRRAYLAGQGYEFNLIDLTDVLS
jgi:DNA excision repair protein ERCC-3